ncbi:MULTISPECIES: hypothetical protein [Streptomyces]|uniref:hypothetical protein n=1 Tax=Streptomyces TaxID=1883 RepID=UPI00224FB5D6|nr:MULTISPECIES: hypothetical protein [Streptomyces]MCX5277695.1 hypothetical protein [Streptomyces virginiae]MCX5583040.1 hypothetical protein [Streptomyces erythrochromogenes]
MLRPAGRIIVSTSHPTADWLVDGGSYFDTGHAEETWSNGMTHRYWRQPLQAWVTESQRRASPSTAWSNTHPPPQCPTSTRPRTRN